jgi:hypothetical protein
MDVSEDNVEEGMKKETKNAEMREKGWKDDEGQDKWEEMSKNKRNEWTKMKYMSSKTKCINMQDLRFSQRWLWRVPSSGI